MHPIKGILTIAIGSAAIALSACQEAGYPAAADAGEPVSQGPTLLYSGTFPDGAALQIVSGPGNEINYSVQTPIGSGAEKRMRLSASQATLADVYRILDPDAAEVPAKVREISDDLASRQALAPASADASEPETAAPLAKTADAADDWVNGYCRDFRVGNILYRFKSGVFKWSANSVIPSIDAPLRSDNVLMDRAYGWNMTPYTGTMSLTASTWKPSIPPNTVMWVQWGGVYQDGLPRLSLPSGKLGQIAISSHRAIRLQPVPRDPGLFQ